MNDLDDEVPEQWLEQLAVIEEQMLSGKPISLDHATPELLAASKVLQELRRIGSRESSSLDAFLEVRPKTLGHYQIGEMLGAGGCAIVYRAHDLELRREVAIKIPLPHHVLNEEARARFLREAQAISRLKHPHIVEAYDAGIEGKIPYIVYAFCPGPTLSQWLSSHGAMQSTDAVKMVASLADAIQHSHDLRVLHRDLKPSNVLLFPAEDGGASFPYVPKLTDFGFAKFLETAANLTRSSTIVGTPIYVSPEQLNSPKSSLGVSSDIFGLGLLLFESLTGGTPCQSESVIHALDQIRTGDYAKLRSRRDIPRDLARICDKALAFEPADRYPSAGQMKLDLERFLRGERVAASPPHFLKKLRRFAVSPMRVREAAGYMVLANLALLLWIFAWPVAIVFNLPMASGTTNEELLPYTLPLGVLHVLFITLGVQTARQRIWAAGIGTLLSGLSTLIQFAILSRWISPPYPTIYPDVRTRDIVFLLLFSLFAFQFMLGGCAWAALRYRRGSE